MKSVILIVLDGYGIGPPGPGNAIYLANPINMNNYLHSYPNTVLKASGESVGLPPGEVGNTEVGHINLGAGRIVFQDLPRINMSIADGSFYSNLVFLNGVEHLKKSNGKLHLIGLTGQGAVHSEIDHLFALLFFAKEKGLKNVFVHAITDGRDSPPKSAKESLSHIEEKLKELNIGKIASVMGRFYAMDRDHRWDRTQKAYECITKGIGMSADSSLDAVFKSYAQNHTDEFIDPTNIVSNGKPIALIEKGDMVIFFNFRIDRPRQLTKAFILDEFEKEANISPSFDPYAVKYNKSHLAQSSTDIIEPFKRGPKIENLFFVTMTEYEKGLSTHVAFPPITVRMPIGRVLSERGVSQLRITESEKERFVTYYFNGQQEMPFTNEERIIIRSPKVKTYDLQPEMSSAVITEILISKIRAKMHQFILVNYPNPDMVGHTGNIEATIKAVKAVDLCLGQVVTEAKSNGYTILITADHGNAEEKISSKTGGISTEHTNNLVPFIAIDNNKFSKPVRLQSGVLADIAPTVLNLLEIVVPPEMSGRNLLEEIV